MPLVRIDLHAGRDAQHRQALGELVYRAMVDVLKSPEHDKFQVIREHEPGALNVTPSYLGIEYSPDVVLIQITLNGGRSTEQKCAFYRRVADDLHASLGIRPQDVIINLVETSPENWSFGNGVAQYVEPRA